MPIRLATSSKAHFHRDVLGFELYAWGADLLVDSGGPYAYGDPRRINFLSTAAHNTVVVDGEDQALGAARVRVWQTTEELDSLCAEHELYAGTLHRRWFVVIHKTYVLLADLLRSNRARSYVQRFHLAPDMAATASGSCVDAAPIDGGPAISMAARPHGFHTLRIAAQPNGPYGWSCIGERRVVPHGIVDFESRGAETLMGVLLTPRRDPSVPAPLVTWNEGDGALFDISVALPGETFRVRLQVDSDNPPELLDA